MLKRVHAQVPTDIQDPLAGRYTSLAQIFGLITNIVIGVGVALTVIFLILAGIQYITAKGDTKAADAARSSLTNAIIGFVIVIGAITIKIIVQNLLNADNVSIDGVTPGSGGGSGAPPIPPPPMPKP